MKTISISYAVMLVVCVIVGSIAALVFCKSWLWVFLSVFPIALAKKLIPELRERIPEFPDFSTVLLVVSSAGLSVIVVSVTLLMRKEEFLSIMCITAAWLAFLMTVWFVSFLPGNKKLEKTE